MGNRIHGEAYILRLNEQECQPEIATESNRLIYMVYEDVPSELMDNDLLKEMMMPNEWRVLPGGGNVVRLGFCRMRLALIKKHIGELTNSNVKVKYQIFFRERAKIKKNKERAERVQIDLTGSQKDTDEGYQNRESEWQTMELVWWRPEEKWLSRRQKKKEKKERERKRNRR